MALILVVDDEPDIRLLAHVVLGSAGHQVIEAASGAEALERVARRPRPDLVVLDLNLGGIDGWEVLGRLGVEHGDSAPPVLVLTGDLAALTKGSYQHVLTKPFQPDAFLTAVERALGTGGVAQAGSGEDSTGS